MTPSMSSQAACRRFIGTSVIASESPPTGLRAVDSTVFTIARAARGFIDTRLVGLPFNDGETRTIDFSFIAPRGATAVALGVVITSPTADGWATLWQTGTVRPLTRAVDFAADRPAAGYTIVGVSIACEVSVFISCATDLVVDVLGWRLQQSIDAQPPRIILSNQRIVSRKHMSPTTP